MKPSCCTQWQNRLSKTVRGGEIKSKYCISTCKPQQAMEILWRDEERKTESNEPPSTVSSWSRTKPQSICLSDFVYLKHLYKAFHNLPSFSAILYTLLHYMNYDLPSGNHEKAVLFYIHHTIILSILYLTLLFQKSITICFNKDEMKYWEWSRVEKQAGICLLLCFHFNVFLIRFKWCQ